jgi:hypothetical protein
MIGETKLERLTEDLSSTKGFGIFSQGKCAVAGGNKVESA